MAIRRAGEGDRERIVRLLDEAFQDDPVSRWVFPDAGYRRRTHHRLMAAFTDAVLAEGRIDLTEDGAACALWLSAPVQPAPDDALAQPPTPAGRPTEAPIPAGAPARARTTRRPQAHARARPTHPTTLAGSAST